MSTLVGVGLAGFLLWLAAQLDRQHTGGYWAAYGIVAGAGVVLALSQLRGRGGHPPGMLVLGFLPVLICAGWVLLGMQPHPNWFRNHVLAWSSDIGIADVVRDLGTWIGVLSLGIGFTFALTLEPFGRRRVAPVATPARTADTPAYDPATSDAPTTAERAEVGDATPAAERTRRTMTAR